MSTINKQRALLFADNPKAAELYFTDDNQGFHKEDTARAHAAGLKKNERGTEKVELITRAEVEAWQTNPTKEVTVEGNGHGQPTGDGTKEAGAQTTIAEPKKKMTLEEAQTILDAAQAAADEAAKGDDAEAIAATKKALTMAKMQLGRIKAAADKANAE